MGGFAGRAVSPSLVFVSAEKETFFLSFWEPLDSLEDPLVRGDVPLDASSESLKRRFFLGASLDNKSSFWVYPVPFMPFATDGSDASSFAYFSFKPSFFQAGMCGLFSEAIISELDSLWCLK